LTLPFGTRLAGSDTAARRASACVLGLGVAAVAVAVGVGAGSFTGITPGVALLAAPALVALGFLVMQGPKWCLAGLIATVVLGYAHDSISLGSIDLRVPDLFLVALAGWVVVLRARNGQRGWIAGRRLLAVWLAVLGFSLYPLLVHGSVDATALVGWMRLVATFSLVWFVPYALYRVRDIEFVLKVIALVTTAEIVRALLGALASGDLGARLSGANDPNTTGLIAAIVVVLALHGPMRIRPSLKVSMFTIGIVGLLMTRSLGSTAAAVLALGVYGIQTIHARRSQNPRQQLVVPTRLLVMVIIGLGAAMALRPSNLPTSAQFGQSTTVHRVVLADAGIQLFQQSPLFGIGWQRAPAEVGSPAVTAALRARFGPDVNPLFFPAVGQPTEVHNAYIQVLAETGLVGFLLLIAVLIALGRGIAGILRSVRSNQRLYIAARAAVVLLVVVLVWWNDNTLYGVQPESVLAATFLGILAATPAVSLATRSDEAAEVST
jgi:O-Antigen ligase